MAAAGLAGGSAAWLLLQCYRPIWNYVHTTGFAVSDAQKAQIQRFDWLNHVVAFAIAGAVLACCCALGASLRGSWKLRICGAVAGLLAGAAGGFLGGWAGHLIDHSFLPLADMAKTMAKHAVVWASVGAGVGCGVAIPLLRFWPVVQAMVTGAVGGLAAAICYESLLGVFFPLESTDILFPTQPANRLVLFCLNGVLIGGFLGLVLTPRAARPQSHAGAR